MDENKDIEENKDETQMLADLKNEQASTETTQEENTGFILGGLLCKQDDDPEKKDPKKDKAAKSKEKEDFIEPYKRSYPKEKLFYVTSDKQVFLKKDHQFAKLHQKSLKGGEVEIIEID